MQKTFSALTGPSGAAILVTTGAAVLFSANVMKAESPRQGMSDAQSALFSRLERLWDEQDKLDEAAAANVHLRDTGRTPTGASGDNKRIPASGALTAKSDDERKSVLPDRHDGQESEAGRSAALPVRNTNIGIFEGEEFELCGHAEFTASLAGSQNGHESLVVSSRDRTIPNIPFRGFEAEIPWEIKTDLWPGCSVIAGFVEVAGIVRIGLSVRETGSVK